MAKVSRGVQIGLRDVYYAILDSDEVGVGVQYQEPERIIGAITANINPNPSMETLFADDGPMETAATLGQIELELNVADLPLDIQAVLLGHGALSAGQLIRKAGDIPPWIALGFKSLKSNGSYRYVWLLKGKFMVPEQSHETKGDTITFQTPTINGQFVKRDYDDAYQLIGDDDVEGFEPSNWFTATKLQTISAGPSKVAKPVVALYPEKDEYANDDEIQVTLFTTTHNAKLYYTLDGEVPTDQDILYEGPFALTTSELGGETVEIKAIATKDGLSDSDVVTRSVVFLSE